jgi:glycosyltransferase involved in cell wall biosynthesis
VGDLVRLTGLRADVGDLLGSADIYLSVSDWEGMSLTAIEAMGSALPIVSTATEGMAHLVGPENGLLVPVGDVAALGEAVASLAEDPARRAALGAASAVRARARFSHDRMIAELMAVVAEVVKPA